MRQRSGEGVVRRNRCPKGCFWRVRFLSAPLRFSGVLRANLKGGREETDSPKTPFWTTVSPHDAFAAPLARSDQFQKERVASRSDVDEAFFVSALRDAPVELVVPSHCDGPISASSPEIPMISAGWIISTTASPWSAPAMVFDCLNALTRDGRAIPDHTWKEPMSHAQKIKAQLGKKLPKVLLTRDDFLQKLSQNTVQSACVCVCVS